MFRTHSKFHKVPTREVLNSPGLDTECAFWVIYSERSPAARRGRLHPCVGYCALFATASFYWSPWRTEAGRQAGGRCGLRRFIPVWLRRRRAHWLPRWANPQSARGLAMGFEFSCSAWSHWCAARAPTRKSQTLSRFSSFLFAGDEAQRKSIILRRSLAWLLGCLFRVRDRRQSLCGAPIDISQKRRRLIRPGNALSFSESCFSKKCRAALPHFCTCNWTES